MSLSDERLISMDDICAAIGEICYDAIHSILQRVTVRWNSVRGLLRSLSEGYDDGLEYTSRQMCTRGGFEEYRRLCQMSSEGE